MAHGALGCMVSLNDLADRPPRPLSDGETLDLGGKRVRHVDAPHVPHAWEARVLYEETTNTLLCGDLCTHIGNGPALTEQDLVGPAMEAEAIFRARCLAPDTAVVMRRLGDLKPGTGGDARLVLPRRRCTSVLRPRLGVRGAVSGASLVTATPQLRTSRRRGEPESPDTSQGRLTVGRTAGPCLKLAAALLTTLCFSETLGRPVL